MFGFDFWEMVVILVVALLVVGPERLPKLAHSAGLWIGKLKRMAANLREELEEEIEAAELKDILNQQQKEINELRDMLQDTRIEPTKPSAKKAAASQGLPDPRMQAVEDQLKTPFIGTTTSPAHEESAPLKDT